jgi:hypothetical protein
MWQSAINYFQSLRTYRDLGPDVQIQRSVNARLNDRPNLALEEWSQFFVPLPNCSPSTHLLTFLYQKIRTYSGLYIGCIRPSDRLIEDLQLPLVCWFDWPSQLCIDFYESFQVDISEEFDESLLETIGDLVCFLDERLPSLDLNDGDSCDRACER